MDESVLAEFTENPLASVFILSVVVALVLRKLWQLHVTLNKAKKD